MAAKVDLKIIEIPAHHQKRMHGTGKMVLVFHNDLIRLCMCVCFPFPKLNYEEYFANDYLSHQTSGSVDCANTVMKAKLDKPALVFVEGGYENRWTYMRAFVHNSPTWNDHVLYPNDLGDNKNKELMAYFPVRLYFRFQPGKMETEN